MSCCGSTSVYVSGSPSHTPSGSLSDSTLSGGSVDRSGGHTPASGVVLSSQSGDLSSPGQASSDPILVNPVLAFIKAFRLQEILIQSRDQYMRISLVSLLKLPRRHYGITVVLSLRLLLFPFMFVGTLKSVVSSQL